MTRPNSGERPESGPEIVNLTGYTSLAKSVVFCMSSSFFFFFCPGYPEAFGFGVSHGPWEDPL